MLNEFFKWWGGQLASFVPARFSGVGGSGSLTAEFRAGVAQDFLISQRRRAREMRLGAFGCDAAGMLALRARLARLPARVVLRVPADLLLEREVLLPAAAERNWRNALRFEMNRLTPFSAEQVFWNAAIERRDTIHGKLAVRLWLIPKTTLATAIAVLRTAGLPVAAIEAPDQAGSVRLISLIEPGGGKHGVQAPVLVLAGLCAALALAAAGLPFVLQTERGDAVARDIARLQPAVARAQALRHDRLANAANADVIATARSETGDPLAVLAAVTRALPDDGFLTELTLNHLRLNIAGQAASAAPLLIALSADPLLTNVSFSAPVTHDTGKRQDLFAIQSTVVPR